jgi:hypothetical protein
MSNEAKLARWNEFLRTANADSKWVEFHRLEDEKRAVVRQEMLELLNRFRSNETTVAQFRTEFDSRTRKDWDVFGLKGLSGAMFLNKLVKHVPDLAALTTQLQTVLAEPPNRDSGIERLESFLNYLQGLVVAGTATKAQLQPGRAPFFVSAWWHAQNPESWPAFYQSARRALELEGNYETTGDTAKDYFAFRDMFSQLSQDLFLSSWACEHLLDWYCDSRAPDITPPTNESDSPAVKVVDGSPDEGDDEFDSAVSHTQLQWLLAQIGKKLGCNVWIAANDHSKSWNGQRLGDLSVAALPTLGLDSDSQKIIGLIDVVWIKGSNQISAAFEIEHTTSIFSGLLRMSDLIALSPNLNFPLYLVAPEARLAKVRKQLMRPTFQTLELHKRCGFFSDEALVQEADQIMKWANDVTAIARLASVVGDVRTDS